MKDCNDAFIERWKQDAIEALRGWRTLSSKEDSLDLGRAAFNLLCSLQMGKRMRRECCDQALVSDLQRAARRDMLLIVNEAIAHANCAAWCRRHQKWCDENGNADVDQRLRAQEGFELLREFDEMNAVAAYVKLKVLQKTPSMETFVQEVERLELGSAEFVLTDTPEPVNYARAILGTVQRALWVKLDGGLEAFRRIVKSADRMNHGGYVKVYNALYGHLKSVQITR